jgi:hypothetical protein
MDCKGFGRKQSCPNPGIIQEFAWTEDTAGVADEIGTEHLRNTILENYR